MITTTLHCLSCYHWQPAAKLQVRCTVLHLEAPRAALPHLAACGSHQVAQDALNPSWPLPSTEGGAWVAQVAQDALK